MSFIVQWLLGAVGGLFALWLIYALMIITVDKFGLEGWLVASALIGSLFVTAWFRTKP